MHQEDLLVEETKAGQPFTVSQITSLIRNDLEGKYSNIEVEGEISNCKTAASGHLYFSLKDDQAVLQAVMFKLDLLSLAFIPKDGMKVWAKGGISVYAGRGQYQLIARSMRESGIGDILAMLEERKKRLSAEGLFAPEKKKSIPRFPSRIGVITSPTGAAIKDIIHVLSRRNPKTSILVFPALVQGEDAALSIASRINQANYWNLVDVLIVGRGGGSIEDLLPFSEEIVVRAIANSYIPVISAVGHETDWALSDYAADLRAPTPSAAAEMACGDLSLIEKEIDHFEAILVQSMNHFLVQAYQRLFSVSPRNLEDILVKHQLQLIQRFDSALDFLSHSMQQKKEQAYNRVMLAANSIEVSNPHEIMKRGFSIVKMKKTHADDTHNPLTIVKNSIALHSGDSIQILFYKGEAEATIDKIIAGKERS